jgi:hypothetical protein
MGVWLSSKIWLCVFWYIGTKFWDKYAASISGVTHSSVLTTKPASGASIALKYEDEGSSEILVSLSINSLLPWRWRQKISPERCTYLHSLYFKTEGTGYFEIVVPTYNHYTLYMEEINFSETWISTCDTSFGSEHGSSRIPWKAGSCMQSCCDPIPVGSNTQRRRPEDLKYYIRWLVYSCNSDWEHFLFFWKLFY